MPTPDITKVNTPAPALTVDQLLALLVDTQKENAKNQKLLAEALLESRKPYVDPAVIAARQHALDEKRRQVAITILQRQETKRQCSHTRSDQAGNPDPTQPLNIKWQEHSNGIILGVCGTCFSQFDSRNPEDAKLLRGDVKSLRNMGRARGVAHQY